MKNSINSEWHSSCHRGANLQTTATMQITKFTLPEQQKNDMIIDNFMFTLLSQEMHAFKCFLHDDGKFFGNYSKEQAVAYFFRILFKDSIVQNWPVINVNRGVSLEIHPGKEVLEFRIIPQKYSELMDIFEHIPFGTPARKEIEERVYKFVVMVKDDKIYGIEIPKKVQAQKEVERLIKEN